MKINILYLLLYLISGICFAFVFGVFLVFLQLGKLAQVAGGLDVVFGNDIIVNLVGLFLLIIVTILPVSFYLSKFYGKLKVYIIAVVIALLLTTVVYMFNNQRYTGSSSDIIEITPQPIIRNK